MNQYLFIIIWTLFLWAVYEATRPVYYREDGRAVTQREVSWGYLLLLIIPITVFCATRGDFADTSAYRNGYENFSSIYPNIRSILEAEEKGPGFDIIQYVCTRTLGSNSTVFLGLLALVQIMVLLKFYKKYSPNFWIAVFIFLASTDYLSWMQNGTRQFLAVSLVLYFADYIFERKYIRMMLVILVATTIHVSALVMIPVIFIVQGKAWNFKTLLLIAASVAALSALEAVTGIVGELLQETNYEKSFADWQSSNDDGVNPIRVLVYSVPTLLSLIGLRYVRYENNNVINIACNMGIVSTVLYILAMFTSGIYVGRLPVYCSMFSNGIFLPWILKNAFTDRSYRPLVGIMIVCYAAFYYYQSHFIWGLF